MARFDKFKGARYMREFTLALGGDEALYEQIAQFVIGEIKAGRTLAGERLPSKRALMRHLGVSRNTVETAYQVLVAEGYVEGRERSGYFALGYERPVPSASAEARQEAEPPRQPAFRYRFSTAEVDTSIFPYATWAALHRQVMRQGASLLSRGHPQGDAELRSALCELLRQYRGVSCQPYQLVVGAGLEYLLQLLIRLFPEGTRFALEDPGYRAAYHALDGARPVRLDGAGMDVAALAGSEASVAYVTPSHQFPTGITMPAGRRAQLIAWANAAAGRYLIEDDYDSEFRHTTRPIPAMQGMDGGRVIYLGTVSRSIAPSIRVAYMALPEGLLSEYRRRFGSVSNTVSRFEQQVLARFIAEGHYARHLRRMSALYQRRRNLLVERLLGTGGVCLSGHEAGLHFLLRHARLSEGELVARAAEAGVQVHGLSEYAHESPVPDGTLVLGYGGLNEAQIEGAAEALREAWA